MNDLKQKARSAVERCPHCGQRVGIEPSLPLHYRCRICGGPRVPLIAAQFERSNREKPELVRAKRAQRAQWLYRALWIVSGVIGGFGFLVTFLTLLLFSALTTAWASVLLFPAVPLLLALWARSRARRAKLQTQQALSEAWSLVAHEVLGETAGELTSRQLAESMLTDEQHADRLLARLNVDDRVRSRITEDGDVTYSVRARGRVRLSTQELDSDATLALQELEQTLEARAKSE